MDAVVEQARWHIDRYGPSSGVSPVVQSFFDEPTNTVSYVVSDRRRGRAAIIDSVLGFDPASGRTTTGSAEAIIAHVETENLTVDWLLETHVHADHLSAAPYLQQRLGGRLGISRAITRVQDVFGRLFNDSAGSACDGAAFDHLFDDGDRLEVGRLQGSALHVPGHTPADMAFVIGDAAFVGDTLFMPDFGTARADFPGGDARQLYRSIRRLLDLPPQTRMFLCHDYKAPGRDHYVWETTVAMQRRENVHVHDGVNEDEFVAMREARDATLTMPRLILPSIQVNIHGGRLPAPEDNGTRYLRIPLDVL